MGETEEMGFVQPGEEATWRGFATVYCYLKGSHREIRARFSWRWAVRMTLNEHILQQGTLRLDIRKKKLP